MYSILKSKEVKGMLEDKNKEIKCPFCSSTDMIKAGVVYGKEGATQRYHCKTCHRFTINPKVTEKKAKGGG